jgi:hypothetical protein
MSHSPNRSGEYNPWAVGLALFAGAVMMTVGPIGIFLVSLSALANFLWIPYYPVWSVLLIALDVAVIWALCVYAPQRA